MGLQMCQQNPQMINMLMQSDPRIMKCLSVVMGVNLQNAPGGAPPPAAEPEKPKEEPKKEPEKELTEEEKAELKLQEEAAAEKELGTAAYKQKDFETAVVHYQKAYEIYPKDISPLTNVAACQFEQDDFDGCIDTCMDAIAKGREVMCDYKLIAKAFVRIGNTHMRRAARADGFEA